ncbi:MAG: hypothetical protein RL662_473 [Bacteroidota bacterium]|jgi:ribosomal protein L29
MTERQEKLLDELDFRMRQLMYLYDSLKEENVELKNQIVTKDEELTALNTELEQLKSKYDNLRFVKTLAGVEAEGVAKTKRRLSKLVQDVEKCISLLKK